MYNVDHTFELFPVKKKKEEERKKKQPLTNLIDFSMYLNTPAPP